MGPDFWLNFNLNTFTFSGVTPANLLDKILNIFIDITDGYKNLTLNVKVNFASPPPSINKNVKSLED